MFLQVTLQVLLRIGSINHGERADYQNRGAVVELPENILERLRVGIVERQLLRILFGLGASIDIVLNVHPGAERGLARAQQLAERRRGSECVGVLARLYLKAK